MKADTPSNKLKEALKFYADPANYKQVWIASGGFMVSEVYIDSGTKAREALKEERRTWANSS